MASLVNTLRSFQNGLLSKEELFAEVDQILEGGRADEAWLLETLDKENTKLPLPEDIHNKVQNKIEQSAECKRKSHDSEAVQSAQAEAKDFDPDESQTRLATSLFVNGTGPLGGEQAREWSPDTAAPTDGAEPERMKGKGDVLNERFVLEERIGTGGMSTVYKALDRRKLEADDRNPYVAVKVLNVEFRAHPDSLIALQREAKKSQSLAHPNIVRVYDFDRDGSTVYMTMEYLSGQPLAKILRAPGFKGLPEDQCMQILEGIAEALRFAHDCGIIHADFKPANVILTDDNKVKVIDFGISRAFQRPEDTDMEATRFDPGSLGALTPTYASPEMLEHKEPDPRDDIYALACITYEMFTGRHPFGRMQATEARDGGLEAERRKHLSRRQWRALKSALDFDRDKRTSSITKFVDEMRPRPAISNPESLKTAGKFALAASAGFLLFYFMIPALTTDSTDEAEIVVEADSASKEADVDLASMQIPNKNDALINAVDTKPAKTDDPPASPPVGESTDGGNVLAKVTIDPVVPAKPPVKATLASVKGVLDPVACSAFDASLNDGVVSLNGYVSRKLDVQKLEQDILALPGIKEVDTSLSTVDIEKCAVLDVFRPYWEANRKTDTGVAIQAKDDDAQLIEGDPLVIELSTPDYETYVNVDYFSLDGGVVHMVPSPRAKNNQAPANYNATIGDLGEWTIGEPFGKELITLVLTTEPLFKDIRSEYEDKKDYLNALESRLKDLSKKGGKDKIAVDFVMIDTKPKTMLQKLREKAVSNN